MSLMIWLGIEEWRVNVGKPMTGISKVHWQRSDQSTKPLSADDDFRCVSRWGVNYMGAGDPPRKPWKTAVCVCVGKIQGCWLTPGAYNIKEMDPVWQWCVAQRLCCR